jgi:hypothetical protein
MTKPTAFISLLLLPVVPAFPQISLSQAGYSSIEPLEVAPGQVVLISTYGIPGRAGRSPVFVSIPEVELDGLRASMRYPGLSTPPVQFLGIRQTGCDNNASASCDPLTALTVVMPLSMPPVGMTAELIISDRGRDVRAIPIRTVPDRIHIVTTCDDVAVFVGNDAPGEECGPVVRRASSGRRVTAQDPARPGETIVAWAYGLGLPGPPAGADFGRLTSVLNPPALRFLFGPPDFLSTPAGPAVAPAFAAAFPPSPLYQINITLPEVPRGLNLPPCDGRTVKWNTTILVSGLSSMGTVRLCMVP